MYASGRDSRRGRVRRPSHSRHRAGHDLGDDACVLIPRQCELRVTSNSPVRHRQKKRVDARWPDRPFRLALSLLPTLTRVRRDSGRQGVPCRGWLGSSVNEPANQGRVSCGSGDGSEGWSCWSWRLLLGGAPMVRAVSARSRTRCRWCGPGRRAGRAPADSQVIPALIERLADADPVVRLAAHEELRKRTGRDFGYVPWASPEERAGAIGRWRSLGDSGARKSGTGGPADGSSGSTIESSASRNQPDAGSVRAIAIMETPFDGVPLQLPAVESSVVEWVPVDFIRPGRPCHREGFSRCHSTSTVPPSQIILGPSAGWPVRAGDDGLRRWSDAAGNGGIGLVSGRGPAGIKRRRRPGS